ncbi:hypothetical protein MKZ38_000889 [Zalerion maritima]|uniref:NAD+ kinase n=1 Tax=Zalerion maritima TaxID=339359 RepID=A0AAD5RXU0_9PEZI|nr:hypothetical protein MKZ38_000889 [Zalerion maritima]
MGPLKSNHNQGKHVSFEEAAHSSASDDDSKAVEVSFDPQNPYRRKSSLVASEVAHPHLRGDNNKTQCIVHQFLESQQPAPQAARPKVMQINGHGRESSEEISHELGHNRLVEPKGSQTPTVTVPSNDNLCPEVAAKLRSAQRRSPSPVNAQGNGGRIILENDTSENSDAGQVDEKSWQRNFEKSKPEADRSGMSTLDNEHDALHSRLLTKKQLSEMAWGVRELSRRLGSMRLKFRVKNIFLLTKIYDRDLIPKTRELTKWLLSKERDVRFTVFVEKQLKENKAYDAQGLISELADDYLANGELGYDDKDLARREIARRHRYWDMKMCRARPHMFDLAITLGGDGTVLYSSWLFQRIVPPVLSFSLGSLGFLTKFDFEGYTDTLTTAFRDGVTVSLRLRFEGTVMRSQRRKIDGGSDSEQNGSDEVEVQRGRDLVEELIGEEKDDEHTHKPEGTYEILNEIVVDRGPNATMSCTEIFGDDEHFTSVMADGVCVSTPTGSTAYNLAAGGSLCHPENPVMLVTSICAHTLSFRPIILPDTIVLRIGVPYDARTNSWASFDGRERVELKPGDYVTISASRYPFASVTPRGRRSEDWVNSIQHKLGWNTRQKQKTFKEWDT